MQVPDSNAYILADAASAQAALRRYDAATRSRGEEYHRQGAVEGIFCIEPGRKYRARVAGGQRYEVDLDNSDGHRWALRCSCPIGSGGSPCKHGYAALKALIAAHSEAMVHQLSAGKGASSHARPSANTAPSPTDFEAKVTQALARELKPAEKGVLNRLTTLRQSIRSGQPVFSADLQDLGIRLQAHSWDRVRLSPTTPNSDEELWQFIAYYAAAHGASIPTFLHPVTDTAGIQAQLAQWQRRDEINRWRESFRRLGEQAGVTMKPSAVQLRLRFEDDEAFLEWRHAESEKYSVIKPTKFVDFDTRYGAALAPEVALLWQSFAQRARLGYSITLPYHDPFTRDALNRVLRLPLLAPYTVAAEGEPLDRPTEPLKWDMQAPESATGDYALRLVRADGTPLPHVLIRLAGHPTLVVTRDAVFQGPHGEEGVIDPASLSKIPAEALETREGLRFLQRLQAPLPPRLADRVRTVPLRPLLRAELVQPVMGYDTEYCHVEILGVTPEGVARERWTGQQWLPLTPSPPPAAKNEDPNEPFEMLDRSLLGDASRLIEPAGFKWDYSWQRWALRVTKKFADLFVPLIKSLPSHVILELRGELASFHNSEVSGEVRLDIKESAIDWFDLQVIVNVSDTNLSQAEIKLLLDAKGKWVRLGEKGWRKLEFKLSKEDDEELARLGLNPHELTSEPQRLHALQLADPAARRFLDEEKFNRVQRRARELQARVTPDVPTQVRVELRPYQREGFHFLAYLSTNHFGGILADDMGLGKTLQTLAWLAWLRQQPPPADTPSSDRTAPLPSLVVCPKSVCDNWRAECERFVEGLRVRVWSSDDVSSLPSLTDSADLHIVNYAQLRSIAEPIAKCDFLAVILDEGQYIKNPSSMTAIVARTLRSTHRLVLSGTPIENQLMDLWSLMSFAMPGALGSRGEFSRLFDSKEDPFARRRLSARVRPFLLRRTKAQVAKDLPDRIEEDLYCELEGEQKAMYRAELKRAQQTLLGIKTVAALNKQRFNVLTSLLRLRQICCHPRLLKPDSKGTSAKIESLMEVLEPLMEEGQKVLVFSQFVEVLELVKTAVAEQEWPTYYLAGETENRGELVRTFQEHVGAAVFLISLKAGGFGLNLTAASYVVLFDPWWNPAVENQAIDRTHRIGQTQKVIAYRLLIKGSIEEKIRQLQGSKKALAEEVLGEEKFAQGLSLDDLRFLLAD